MSLGDASLSCMRFFSLICGRCHIRRNNNDVFSYSSHCLMHNLCFGRRLNAGYLLNNNLRLDCNS